CERNSSLSLSLPRARPAPPAPRTPKKRNATPRHLCFAIGVDWSLLRYRGESRAVILLINLVDGVKDRSSKERGTISWAAGGSDLGDGGAADAVAVAGLLARVLQRGARQHLRRHRRRHPRRRRRPPGRPPRAPRRHRRAPLHRARRPPAVAAAEAATRADRRLLLPDAARGVPSLCSSDRAEAVVTDDDDGAAAAVAPRGDCHDRVAAEAFRVKAALSNAQEKTEAELLELLRALQQLEFTVDAIRVTEIGTAVKPLRKHGSKQIRQLVRSLIE
ncbi:Os03g0364700, partial [Oryza sativa Japonica Group]